MPRGHPEHLARVGLLLTCLGCGARSSLDVTDTTEGGDGGGDTCEDVAMCADLTRGTLTLEAADGAALGTLFLFDATGSCNGSPQYMLLQLALEEDGRPCSRFGDYEVVEMGEGVLAGVATNLGGSVGPGCGGTPFDETVTFELRALPCEPDRFSVSVQDSEGLGSPYSLAATATRCRCDIGWEPCEASTPPDPCAF